MNAQRNTMQERAMPFAQRQLLRRQKAASALAARVVRPVEGTKEPAKRPATGASFARGGLYLAAAVMLHGSVAAALMWGGVPGKEKSSPVVEQVVFQMAQKPKLEEAAAREVEEELAAVETPAPVVETAEKKVVERPRKVLKPLAADPVTDPDPAPSQERRRIVGLSLSSTVQGGGGPSFAVGNTRMGQTEAVAQVNKVGKISSRGEIGGTGKEEPDNKVAMSIPGAKVAFEKPRRVAAASPPEYPMELKSRGIEGDVVVLIVIDIDGKVQKVRILKSSGYPEFDEAAKAAALTEMYEPARKDGQAIEYNLKYTYRFRIRGA